MGSQKNILLLLLNLSMATSLALPACSFKKTSQQETEITAIEVKTKEASPVSVEDMITQEDEEIALEQLALAKIEDINFIRTKAGSLLDTAIQMKRERIIKLLTIKGHSPFVISEYTYKALSLDLPLNKILSDLQDNALHVILTYFPDTIGDEQHLDDIGIELIGASLDTFDQAIRDTQLGAVGCAKFANFLMNLNFGKDSYKSPTNYRSAAGFISAKKAFIYAMENSECAKYTSTIPIQNVSQWISSEIYAQYKKNFPAPKLLKSFLKIASPKSVGIFIPTIENPDLPSNINVSPLALLMLKKTCLHRAVLQEWFNLLSPISDTKNNSYVINYKFPPGDRNSVRGSHECKSTFGYCSKEGDNPSSILNLFKLLISTDKDLTEYFSKIAKEYYKGEFTSTTSPTQELLKEKLCWRKHISNQDDADELREQSDMESDFD